MAKPIKQQTWSRLDAIGLLNGLSTWDSQYRELKYVRKPFDSVSDLRKRILDNQTNKVDSTKQGLVNGLANEFGLPTYNVINTSIFELSYTPICSGSSNIQDIYCYYKEPNSSVWNHLTQVWADSYNVAKTNKNGFIVWQNDRYTTDVNLKNFSYTNVVEIVQDLPDLTELKFIYYIKDVDVDNNNILLQFTDINNPSDPTDIRYTYRKENKSPSFDGVVAYTLNSIPENLYSGIYFNSVGKPKEMLYIIKDHLNKKFKHKWGQITDRQCIWDVNRLYGSGVIPHFFDAIAPDNVSFYNKTYSGYIGGVEELSDVLYPSEIIESSGNSNEWYLTIFPGRFYIDGIPFYYFENPKQTNIQFQNGSCVLPSGLTRGMYTILALSGYYDTPFNGWIDPFLSGIFEDYNYPVGDEGLVLWSNIYRKRPHIQPNMDHVINLQEGEYNIDFTNGIIYADSTITDAVLIWDEVLQPSGIVLQYDLNPLNEKNLTFEKFFLYLTLDRK